MQPDPPPTGPNEMPVREIDILHQAVSAMQERLPEGWSAHVTAHPATDRKADATIELLTPDGTSAALLLEVKRSLVTRDLHYILEQLRSAARHLDQPATPVVAARYLASSARKWLEERGVSYIDVTGNMSLRIDRPALFLRDRGADRDPWRGPGRPRGSLKGPPAARVVRALVDFAPPISVPELVRHSGASTGATYRVVEFLEQEALIEREPRGAIRKVAWRRLLERWSKDYGFQRNNAVGTYLAPRGIQSLLNDLANISGLRYAVTGSLAAHRLAPYAAARLAMIYVDHLHDAAKLKLRPVETGANVLLAAGDYDVVFDRLLKVDGVRYTAPSQTVVDLITGPGRSPAEAEALLDWMEDHEQHWRR